MIYVARAPRRRMGTRPTVISFLARMHALIPSRAWNLADDVRCTHGATVGKLEQEPLFYLKSRGIPEKEAERLIVEGFFRSHYATHPI